MNDVRPTQLQAIARVENGRTAAMMFARDDAGRGKFYCTQVPRGDCVARAIAIGTGLSYRKVHRKLIKLQRAFSRGEFARKHGRPATYEEHSSGELRRLEQPQHGVDKGAYHPWLIEELGWIWTPCMHIGSRDRVRLGVDPLPSGSVIVKTYRHLSAVTDGVLRDMHTIAIGRVIHGYYQPSTA